MFSQAESAKSASQKLFKNGQGQTRKHFFPHLSRDGDMIHI